MVPPQLTISPNRLTTAKNALTNSKKRVKHACLHHTGLMVSTSLPLCFLILLCAEACNRRSERAQGGKQYSVPNVGRFGQENDQPVNSHAHTSGRGHAMFKCEQEIIIKLLCFLASLF